jgi:hypothetical protein
MMKEKSILACLVCILPEFLPKNYDAQTTTTNTEQEMNCNTYKHQLRAPVKEIKKEFK